MNPKAELRKDAELRRHSLVRPDFPDALASYAAALSLPAGAVVSGYWAFRDEADPRALMLALAERGHPLCLPVIVEKAQPLRFHRWNPSDVMRVHAYGVTEPQRDAAVITPSVLLVPLLAFDATGYRLGYGGGFYDRTLQSLRAIRNIQAIGIAYAGQEVPAVPHHEYDERLNAVLTEKGLRRF
jgi:5-formyltetrahydrofolate cyclo-ligase